MNPDPPQFDEIEKTTGFCYPADFRALATEYSILCSKAPMRARLVISLCEIHELQKAIHHHLFPFMIEPQNGWSDIYAFDYTDNESEYPVVVWADHAIVEKWATFREHFNWLRDTVENEKALYSA